MEGMQYTLIRKQAGGNTHQFRLYYVEGSRKKFRVLGQNLEKFPEISGLFPFCSVFKPGKIIIYLTITGLKSELGLLVEILLLLTIKKKHNFRREIRNIMEANNYEYIGTVFEDLFVGPENFEGRPEEIIDDIFLRKDKVTKCAPIAEDLESGH